METKQVIELFDGKLIEIEDTAISRVAHIKTQDGIQGSVFLKDNDRIEIKDKQTGRLKYKIFKVIDGEGDLKFTMITFQ